MSIKPPEDTLVQHGGNSNREAEINAKINTGAILFINLIFPHLSITVFS